MDKKHFFVGRSTDKKVDGVFIPDMYALGHDCIGWNGYGFGLSHIQLMRPDHFEHIFGFSLERNEVVEIILTKIYVIKRKD